ncbi:hypothetical protein Tco_0251007 [Tanacetum coccineum]
MTNSEHYEALPLKETVKAALATLGLVDEKNPHLTPSKLINFSSLRIRYLLPIWRVLMLHIVKCLGGMQGSYDHLNTNYQVIAYSLIWGLDVDMGNIIFSKLVVKLVNCKKDRELTTLKPHHINVASFNENPSASKVPLISHMLKMAKINEFEKSLLLSYREVNTDSAADKSLSGTTVQRPKQKKPVTETQHAEEPVATADTTQSLDASKFLTLDVDLKNSRLCKDLQHPAHEANEHVEDQMDTDVEITFMGATVLDQVMEEVESDLEFMPNDEIMSISGDDDDLADSDKEISAAD